MNKIMYHPRYIPQEEVDEIMLLHSKGFEFREIAEKTNRTTRSIEGVVSRNRGYWTRDFNFPHIIHAKRFGA